MQYPLISEYVRAMQDPTGNLDQLAHLVPALDDHGEPMRSSGAFAVVFKMKDESTGKEYALKCFTEEQEGRAEAYRQIADELESVDSTYVTSVKYFEKELFVDCDGDDHEFPVLLMDWIDGETMDHYISESRYDNYAMSMLCYRFCKMAAWLRSQPFAHGDIKPDNIMIRSDGSLTLIDYDGMFVPSMKGQTSPTIGTKDFSHPLRTKEDFDETIDDFSLATITLSLKAISLSPSLFDEYASADRLLFSADDYRDLSQSKVLTALHPLMTDPELNTILSLFLLAHATKTLSMVSFRLFSVSKPEYNPIDISSEVTDEDLAEAIEDEYGVKYSKDRKRLLKAPEYIGGEYRIRKGTICICDSAFVDCNLTSIFIPRSVTKIGNSSFLRCSALTGIIVPEGVSVIGESVFEGCTSLTSIVIPNNMTEIGGSAFRDCIGLTRVVIPNGVARIGDFAFCGCSGLASIVIPNSVTEIEYWAFSGCTSLTSIVIPSRVTEIRSSAFSGCTSLPDIVIPNSVTEIGNGAFYGCTGLISIVIPDSVTEIGWGAFRGCTGLTSIVISEGVTEIGEFVFEGCTSLTSIVIPNNVTEIGRSAFRDCIGLTSIVIPEGVMEIGESAFVGCTGTTGIVIPNSVTEIRSSAFADCTSLTSIVIPDSVTEIGCGAFNGCTSLANISVSVYNHSYVSINNCCLSKDLRRLIFGCRTSIIPEGLSMIEKSAFFGCTGLTSIVIPDSVTEIGCGAFYGCTSLTSIVIPEGVTKIGRSAFKGCTGLANISVSVDNPSYVSINNCCLSKDLRRLIFGCRTSIIPEGVSMIEESAFYGCTGLTSIVIPNSVTYIGLAAFYGCTSLASIRIPDSVTAIEDRAFYGCNLPESVKKELTLKFGSDIFHY